MGISSSLYLGGLDGVTLWFTPLHGLLDLDQAGELIRGGRQTADGVIPGPDAQRHALAASSRPLRW